MVSRPEDQMEWTPSSLARRLRREEAEEEGWGVERGELVGGILIKAKRDMEIEDKDRPCC